MSRHWVLGQTIIRNIFLLFWRNFRVYIFWSLAISQCLLSDAKLGLSQWLISTQISPHLAYNGAHNICLALDKSEGITCITCIWKKKHLQMSVSPGRHWICGLRRSGKRQFTPFCFLASPTHFPLALGKNVKQLCKLIISILNHTSHKKHTDPLKKSMERK